MEWWCRFQADTMPAPHSFDGIRVLHTMSSLNTCEEEHRVHFVPLTYSLHLKHWIVTQYCWENINIPLPWTSLCPSMQSLSDSHFVTALGICKNESFVMQHATFSSCVKMDKTLKCYRTSGHLLCVWPGVRIRFVNTKKEFSPYQINKIRLIESGIHFYKKHTSLGQTKLLSEKLLQWVALKQM